MRIAINTRFLLPHKMEGFGWYTYEVCKRLVENHPEHTFVFFFDRPYDPKFIFGPNVEAVVLNPPARHPILFVLWFEFAVYWALKKHKIDLFFSPDGYLSLRSKVPQVGVIHDLNFEHFPQDIPWVPRLYLRFFFPKFARKAAQVLTVSEVSKTDICKTYQVSAEKVSVAWNGTSPIFKPLSEVENELFKQNWTENTDYFLFVGALHPRKNTKRLLEAFALYRQKGGRKSLLIVGENLWKNKGFDVPEQVKSAVYFTGHLDQITLANAYSAAFCFVFIPYFEGFGIPLVEAMQAGVPIISGNLSALPEVAGEAALYVDPLLVEEIADSFFSLENDEKTRLRLIQLGLERAKLFSWDFTAAKVWKVLEKELQKNQD